MTTTIAIGPIGSPTGPAPAMDIGRLASAASQPAYRRQAIRPLPDSSSDRVKFLTYAKGSCGEVRTQLYISMEAGILPREPAHAWIEETRHLSAMLYGL